VSDLSRLEDEGGLGDPDEARASGSAGGRASASRRKVVNVHTAAFQEYDMEGPTQPDITWLPISWDDAACQGSYLMRMQPGAVTIEHEHPGFEEFLILEGTLTDSDGTVFKAGDFVSYEGGTHNSWTDEGCLIAVFEWKR
jgi:quercetin dioxygenase-like cupin family protein